MCDINDVGMDAAADTSDYGASDELAGVEADDVALPNDEGYIQGDNEYGLEGDCGLTTIAGNLNEVTGSELTENDVVTFAVENDITSDGATTQTEAVEIYEDLSEMLPDDVNVDVVSIDENNIDDINVALQEGGTLDASVDSGVLWGEKDSYEGIDHAIGIDEPVMDETGEVIGYNIRDTGSGKDFATVEDLSDAGLFDNEQILITKDE